MMDAGIIRVYSTKNSNRGGAPVRALDALKLEAWFEDRSVGMSRYYAARQANVAVDRIARVWRADGINVQDVVVIDGAQYLIQQVQQAFDQDEMPVTDITLERLVDVYDAG